ncbi:NAD-dependent epimerase/dehydratase family protein [Clostridium estertheticum]|uniref:NAD-dependent epimerase/dehydratase family protein n=1 Tax=Clostridium estertheticum TaxID=238834 RepID=UPI001C0D725B|nr:NAD-dependent epimerase/dehydratase family protein [Clostridium estertheticum]MBU3200968.1 NAD-dependent epimerase/dehydratase family protein [Clostridium estertheticum]WAG63390.1 NAD-dependent epimerase/dehydratase family protein [Clostridium estertheticum]
MKTVLITGANGFVGNHMVKHFCEMQYKVYGIDRNDTNNEYIKDSFYRMDLLDNELYSIVEYINPDVCIHCAGNASVNNSVTNPVDDFKSNVNVTFQLLDAIRKSNEKCKVIFLSSAAVYGEPIKLPINENDNCNPISPYGFHKLICEKICEEHSKLYGMQIFILRIFSAYGMGMKKQVLWDMIQKFRNDEVVNLYGNGDESRDFINIDDILNVVDIVLDKSINTFNIYNVATGKELSIKQLSNIIKKEMNSLKNVIFTGKENEGNPNNWRADISKIKKLGFNQSVILESGIKSILLNCEET